MPQVEYIHHGDKQILLMDFANIVDYSVFPGLVEESMRLVRTSNSGRSVLAAIDMSGTRINKTVITSLKKLSRNNGPFMQAVAFVGLSAVWSFVVKLLLWATKRTNHRVIRDRNLAIRWLAQQ